MFIVKNSLSGLLVLSLALVLFFIFFILLIKILILGGFIAIVVFSFYWVKNKLFPNSKQARKYKQFRDQVYSSQTYYRQARSAGAQTRAHYKDINDCKSDNLSENNKSGRIIDIDSESKS